MYLNKFYNYNKRKQPTKQNEQRKKNRTKPKTRMGEEKKTGINKILFNHSR